MQYGRGKSGNLTFIIWLALLLAGAHSAHAQTVVQSAEIREGAPTLPPLGYLSFCERHADQCAPQGNLPNPPIPNPAAAVALYGDRLVPASTVNSASDYPRFNWRAVFISTTPTLAPLGSPDYPAAINTRPSSSVSQGTSVTSAPRASDDFLQQLELVNSDVNSRVRSVSDIDHYGVDDYWELPLEGGGGAGDCEDYALEKRKMLMSRGVSMRALSIALVRTAWNEPHAVLLVHTDKGEYVLDNLTHTIRPWQSTQYTWIKWQSRENPNIWVQPAAR
jgi:predicted transglutaminase-like cysteine proteinase